MKKIYKDKILNILNTPVFDRIFLFDWLNLKVNTQREVVYMKDLLAAYKNEAILPRLWEKPAMYSEVYSPKDELAIFTELFETALLEKKKIHIIGITLAAEIELLEKYYLELGFLRIDINAFDVDFSIPLVTVSCHIENLMWKGSDYKAQRENIFFCPPIRESGQNKALFKGITRGVIAGIDLGKLASEKEWFLEKCIREEHIMPLQMGKILKYNLQDAGFTGEERELKIEY